MIVRRAAQATLQLVTQPDHAALSRRIMERWSPLHGAERRHAILLAVEQHDNGWLEPDSRPAIDPQTGRIYDFIDAPAPVKQAVWIRGIARLSGEDAWAGALVAQHALTIYDRYRDDAAWATFFAAIEAARSRLVAGAGQTAVQLTHDYAFVRIGDLLSLMFCNDWHEEHRFDTWRFRFDGEQLSVDPDPFEGRSLPIAVTARIIPDRRYTSDDDLLAAVRQARQTTLHGVIRGVL